MSIPHEHTNKTLVQNLATKGGATKNVTATFAVASEAEQAAKSPISGAENKNFIQNALFDQDARYPGAGGRVESWAGFSASPLDANGNATGTYPIIYQVGVGTKGIRVRGMPGGQGDAKNFILRVTLQNTAYPGTSYSITKDVVYTSSDTGSAPFYRTVTISDADITALGIGTTATFQSVIFTLLKSDGTTKPGVATSLLSFEIAFQGTTSGTKVIERYDIYGGSTITPGTYFTESFVTLRVPDDSLYGHTNTKASSNSIGSFWAGNRMPNHWKHYCGLYCHAQAGNNYDTFFGKRFYRIRKNKNEYEDIASMHSPTTADGDGGYNLGPNQPRFIEMFPSNGRITARDDATQPQDNINRSYPDITTIGLSDGVPSSLVGSGSWQSNPGNNDQWVKHSVSQSVKIPDGAVAVSYGAYVQVPVDPGFPGGPGGGNETGFKGKNFAAIQISQDYGEGEGAVPDITTNSRFVRGDAIRIAPNNYVSSGLPDVNRSVTGTEAQYIWNGLATTYSASASASDIETNNTNTGNVHPHGFRYPTHIDITGAPEENETGYRDFKLVRRTWKRADQTGYSASGWYQSSDLDDTDTHYNTYLKQIPYLQLELILYEHRANLTEIQPEDGAVGAVRFFNPFIQFFDSSDNIISPS